MDHYTGPNAIAMPLLRSSSPVGATIATVHDAVGSAWSAFLILLRSHHQPPRSYQPSDWLASRAQCNTKCLQTRNRAPLAPHGSQVGSAPLARCAAPGTQVRIYCGWVSVPL